MRMSALGQNWLLLLVVVMVGSAETFVCAGASPETAKPEVKQVEVVVDQAPVGRGKEVVARIANGTTLNVIEKKGRWYGVTVKTDRGAVKGWLHEKMVRPLSQNRGASAPASEARAGSASRAAVDDTDIPERMTRPLAEADVPQVLNQAIRSNDVLLVHRIARHSKSDVAVKKAMDFLARTSSGGTADRVARVYAALSWHNLRGLELGAALAQADLTRRLEWGRRTMAKISEHTRSFGVATRALLALQDSSDPAVSAKARLYRRVFTRINQLTLDGRPTKGE